MGRIEADIWLEHSLFYLLFQAVFQRFQSTSVSKISVHNRVLQKGKNGLGFGLGGGFGGPDPDPLNAEINCNLENEQPPDQN